jgi:hypothetical protein
MIFSSLEAVSVVFIRQSCSSIERVLIIQNRFGDFIASWTVSKLIFVGAPEAPPSHSNKKDILLIVLIVLNVLF